MLHVLLTTVAAVCTIGGCIGMLIAIHMSCDVGKMRAERIKKERMNLK